MFCQIYYRTHAEYKTKGQTGQKAVIWQGKPVQGEFSTLCNIYTKCSSVVPECVFFQYFFCMFFVPLQFISLYNNYRGQFYCAVSHQQGSAHYALQDQQ